MLRAPRAERLGGKDGPGIEWIVVAGQQVDGDVDRAQRLERPGQHRAVQLVGLEHIAADDDERAPVLARTVPEPANRVEPGLLVARPGLVVEEVRGHPELPVRAGQEPHHGCSPPYTGTGTGSGKAR